MVATSQIQGRKPFITSHGFDRFINERDWLFGKINLFTDLRSNTVLYNGGLSPTCFFLTMIRGDDHALLNGSITS